MAEQPQAEVSPEAPRSAHVTPWLRRLVGWMDDAIRIPGTNIRIGWDPILGMLLPGAGDAVTAVSQIALLLAAVRARASWLVLARMILNVGLDSLLGSVPLIGDAFDFGFKANRKNLQLVERLAQEGAGPHPPRSGDYVVLGVAISLVLAVIAAPLLLVAWLAGRLFSGS